MKRSILVEIRPRGKDEPIERMIKRFSKKVKKEKIIEKLRDRRYYEKPSEKRKRAARRRQQIIEKVQRELNEKYKDTN